MCTSAIRCKCLTVYTLFVHIIALLQEESLLVGDEMQTKSLFFFVALITLVLRTIMTLIRCLLFYSNRLKKKKKKIKIMLQS